MLVSCWSAKGGVGTTVVAAGVALGHRGRGRQPTVLVDLAGDLPACLGLAAPVGPGVAEWSRAGAEAPPDALTRLAVPVVPGLVLLHRGRGPFDRSHGSLLVQVLRASGRFVVADCGWVPTADGGAAASGPTLAERFAGEADRSLAVTRPCHLALRRLAEASIRPSGVVVVGEVGRALTTADVERVAGAPVVAEVAVDPAVARAVDAGLLAVRLPRRFLDVLGQVA